MAVFLMNPAPPPLAPLPNWGGESGVGERKELVTHNEGHGARSLIVPSNLRCICT